MPASFNGIGSRYYGKCERRDDDSYLTTEWFVICYLPIVPLASFRVIRDPSGDRTFLGSPAFHYDVLERLPIYWPQVWRVYGFILFTIGWYTGVVYTNFEVERYLQDKGTLLRLGVTFFLLSAPWLGFWLARWRGAKADRKKFS